jgi:c-di-GMP-binding flagellar brake protein YcgR
MLRGWTTQMAMQQKWAERRREVRYPVEAPVTVRRNNGESMDAIAVDISSSGMRLRLGERCPLQIGEEITIEIQILNQPDQSFFSWGVGRVAHIDGGDAGIQLSGGQFDPADPGALP